MKKPRNLFGIIVLLVLIAFATYLFFQTRSQALEASSKQTSLWNNYTLQEKTIEGKNYKLIVADNPERWQKGLMFVRKPVKGYDGMIFIFPDYDYRTFWNLNTVENLTLYWMKDDEVTGTSPLPSIEESKNIVRVSSPEPVNIVVEIIK
jgi:uncharacterized membrane protein (UPF0127 family)